MKSFQTFGTTNELYGKFYSHGQPNKYGEEIYGDPKIEEDFKHTVHQMHEGYFNHRAHLTQLNKTNDQ